MNDLLLFLVTLIPLLGYIAKDVGARLEEGTAHETRRRVATVSIIVVLYSIALTAIISQLSGSVPWGLLEGPALFIIQPVSTFALIFLASDSFGAARDTSKQEEANKVKVADYIDQQLAGRLKPLEGAVAGVQTGVSELSKLVNLLDKELEHLDPYIQSFAKDVTEQTKTVKGLAHEFALREQQYLKVTSQYNEWYDRRMSANRELVALTAGAETMLERAATLVDEIDELLGTVGVEGDGPKAPASPAQSEGGNGSQPQGTDQAQPNPAAGGETPLPTGGKLTKEKGMANRERGNRAQLKFAEEVLRGAGKLFDNSIKEGTPDYVFWAPGSPETRKAKAVGAFKALTLKEDGTRQRHIPRRKVLAELRMATKYAVPMILFVMNFTNGRIWAKVIPVNELKDFTGLTTPLMLVENDPQAEKTCKETLQMALNLL
jgi:hypothetical protein